MDELTIERLVTALDELDAALERAKGAIQKADRTADGALIARVNSYESILKKQRELVTGLATALKSDNFSEARRLGELVRASSLMIKVDAGFIIQSLKAGSVVSEGEEFQA